MKRIILAVITVLTFTQLSGFCVEEVNSDETKQYEFSGNLYQANSQNEIWNNKEEVIYSVFFPQENKEKTKAIIVCPGGGYENVAFEYEGVEVAKFFAENGYVGIALKYRLPQTLHREYPFEDLKEMIKLVQSKKKEWNIDEIGVMGFSAGGHLAALYSTTAEKKYRPDFTILGYPVITMEDNITHYDSRHNLLGDDETAYDEYSAEKHVTKKTPRTFTFVSQYDELVPVKNSQLYNEALTEKGIPNELHIYPTGGHGWAGDKDYEYLQTNNEALLEWLKTF